MSTFKVSSKSPKLNGRSSGFLVRDDLSEYLVGRILTHIDALGLQPNQDKAVKDLLRQEIYRQFSRDEGTLWIPNEFYGAIQELMYEIRKDAEERGNPMGQSADYEILCEQREGSLFSGQGTGAPTKITLG